MNQRGLVIEAGGASRAAVYALANPGCEDIYLINRDVDEVHDLYEDVQIYKASIRPKLFHVKTVQ